jgi:hypothetical protein
MKARIVCKTTLAAGVLLAAALGVVGQAGAAISGTFTCPTPGYRTAFTDSYQAGGYASHSVDGVTVSAGSLSYFDKYWTYASNSPVWKKANKAFNVTGSPAQISCTSTYSISS